MATFKLSAFADEYSQSFDEQIIGLRDNGIKYMEMRGVDGQGVADIAPEKARELRRKLDDAGLAVSSMGSPIGKYKLTDPIEPHLEALRRVIANAHILGADRLRTFSFYCDKDKLDENRGEVMEKIGMMLRIAQSEGVKLCMENERRIYGESPERSLDIYKYFNGEVKLIFDHANFICGGYEAFPHALNLLKDYIYYFHIKDAMPDETIKPAGEGVGHIPETLDVMRQYDREYFLTLEPHLQVFNGLDKLEAPDKVGHIKDQYASHAEAFAAAANAIKKYI